jgi:hypothetical protein
MFSSQAPIHFSEVEETFIEPPVVKLPRLSETAAAPLLTVRRVPSCLEPKVPLVLEPLSVKVQQ